MEFAGLGDSKPWRAYHLAGCGHRSDVAPTELHAIGIVLTIKIPLLRSALLA